MTPLQLATASTLTLAAIVGWTTAGRAVAAIAETPPGPVGDAGPGVTPGGAR